MIPRQFEYHAPQSLPEAIALLQKYGDTAKLLAGGHSLPGDLAIPQVAVNELEVTPSEVGFEILPSATAEVVHHTNIGAGFDQQINQV